MLRRTVFLVFIVSLLSIVEMAGPVGGAPPDGLVTEHPIEFTGVTELGSRGGAALAHPQTPFEVAGLTASKVVIEHAWEEGIHTRVSGPSLVRQTADEGSEKIMLHDVQADFRGTESDQQPVYLVAGTSEHAVLGSTSVDPLEWTAAREETLLKIGTGPNEVRYGHKSAGFWYTTDGINAKALGVGTLEAHGDFTLFIHDLFIQAMGGDGSWSNWTGYQERERAPGTFDYELRVTVLHVTNGSFKAPGISTLELHLPEVQASVEGSVSTLSAEGSIDHEKVVHLFVDDPVYLEGKGALSIRPHAPAEADEAREPPSLWFKPSRSFVISGASTTLDAVAPAGSAPEDSLRLTFGLLAMFLTAATGSVAAGVVPAPTHRVRVWQSSLWLNRGWKASESRKWSRAVTYFSYATRLDPENPIAWFEYARSALEANRMEMVETISRKAMEVPGADQPDILEIRAIAAWHRGEKSSFEEFVRRLAVSEPEMAMGLLSDLGLEEHRMDLTRRNANQSHGRIDGYS